MNKFAERLKELREEKGLSLTALSELTKFSTACISRWESGLRMPSIDSIITLCATLECTSDYLIGLSED